MKHSGPPIPEAAQERPLRFLDFIRFAALLSLCISPLVALLVTLVGANGSDGGIWEVGIFVAFFPIWAGALGVGCLVMIPVWIWRLWISLARKNAMKTAPQKPDWDQWEGGLYL